MSCESHRRNRYVVSLICGRPRLLADGRQTQHRRAFRVAVLGPAIVVRTVPEPGALALVALALAGSLFRCPPRWRISPRAPA